MKHVKPLLSLIVATAVVCLAFFVEVGGKAERTVRIEGDGPLIVIGVDENYFPLEAYNEKKGVFGFNIEFAKRAFKNKNMNVLITAVDWTNLIEGMEIGEIDAFFTSSIKEKYDYTRPLLAGNFVIFTKRNSQKDSSIKILGIRKSNRYKDKITEAKDYLGYRFYGDLSDLLMAYNSGEVGSICIRPTEFYYVEDSFFNVTDQAGLIEKTLPYKLEVAMGVKKGNNEVLSALDDALADFIKTPEYDELYRQWFDDFPNLNVKIKNDV